MSDVLTRITLSLKEVSTTPRLDAEVLVSHVLKVSREDLLRSPLPPLYKGGFLSCPPFGKGGLGGISKEKQLQALIKRRLAGESIAYLTGTKEFWSLNLFVTKDVLVPRPETEMLVEVCLQHVLNQQESLEVADLGTGSGAIALALAKERKHWNITATDLSRRALNIAKKNARNHRISNIQFFRGDWCQALPHNSYDAILCNPPYVAEGDPALTENGVSHEPKEALVAAENGYQELLKIIDSAWHYLKPQGFLLLEHGSTQQPILLKRLAKKGYGCVQGFSDLAGLPRVVMGQRC